MIAYQRWTGLLGLILLAATWKLWTPQTVFPRVPLVNLSSWLPDWVDWVDWVALAAMAGSLLTMLLLPTHSKPTIQRLGRWAIAAFAIGFLISILNDQHRLQPWAIQFAGLSLLFAVACDRNGRRTAIGTARLLVIGIYFWSALGKLDTQFAYTVGTEMLSKLLEFVGLDGNAIDPQRLVPLVLILPCFELTTALLLYFRSTQKIGVVMGILMHLLLLLVLGPWGLGHRPGVLWWNVYSLGQIVLLFYVAERAAETDNREPEFAMPTWLRDSGVVTVILLLLLPIFERWGYYDHWPSWALYAPHSSRATMLVPENTIARMPPELQQLVQRDPLEGSILVRLPIEQWSLETLGVPIYPQSRFQLGVAIAVAQYADLDRQVVVELRGSADRWNGQRDKTKLVGLDAVRAAAKQYTFNALPRRFSPD